MSTVRVVTDTLRDREERMRRITIDFGIAKQRHFNAPDVDDAYRKLNGRWKESQNELIDGLHNIADILKAIREAFEAMDSELAASLKSGGAGPK